MFHYLKILRSVILNASYIIFNKKQINVNTTTTLDNRIYFLVKKIIRLHFTAATTQSFAVLPGFKGFAVIII